MNANDQKHPPPFNPCIPLVLGILAVSTGAIFARLSDAPALVTAAYRVGIAAAIIAPIAWWKSRDELLKLTGKDLVLSMASGFFLAMHFAAWISSLDYTSVANSTVLVNTNPLWVGLLTPLIAGERIRKLTIISIVISVVGAVIVGLGDFAGGGKALWGDFLALTGSMCAAVYLLLGRNLRRRLSLLPYVFVCYGSAAIILWVIVLGLGLQITGFSGTTMAALWGMALVSQIIGHTSYNWGLKWYSASLIAVTLLGEPIGATILAYFIFDEGLTVAKVVGGIIILWAIYLAAKGEAKT